MYGVSVPGFNQANLEDQVDLLVKYGKCVAKYVESYYHLLFALNDYYVEVVYQKEGTSLVRIHAFTDDQALDKFLDKIDISNLLS